MSVPCAAAPVSVRVLGVPIDGLTMEQAVARCAEAVQTRRPLLIGVVNAAKLVNMRQSPALRDAVLAANLILADGMSVVWAARVLGHRLPERVTGIDLMVRLLERANQHGYRAYFLGATDEVLTEYLRRVRESYPRVQIVGSRNGYFGADEEAALAAEIAAVRADMLFVAMSSPKKEQFLARWAERIDVPVCHGVGGAFDVLAGKVRRAPQCWQRLGLEWLYRVLQEPRRLWRRYLVTNTLFCAFVLRDCVVGQRPQTAQD
jgi:N-acetylglucosaminyldiphosphoundecaprenol N-acetyl-beta-D-mannosaminyltransferase